MGQNRLTLLLVNAREYSQFPHILWNHFSIHRHAIFYCFLKHGRFLITFSYAVAWVLLSQTFYREFVKWWWSSALGRSETQSWKADNITVFKILRVSPNINRSKQYWYLVIYDIGKRCSVRWCKFFFLMSHSFCSFSSSFDWRSVRFVFSLSVKYNS